MWLSAVCSVYILTEVRAEIAWQICKNFTNFTFESEAKGVSNQSTKLKDLKPLQEELPYRLISWKIP